ncbi:LOW QUALITY PROTEIN: galanin receptor type 2 [Pseudonaja textilis]|uniref:LOW QUALITY PROTEIN: galanin receptor type 2 n=1 Tax=Pseudonaja textilis TaxID=8673 RepID=UPI000EA90FCE|nr:LOW QUALITY PROTEIN: galanin receptor type 2 [Pseudonaja textilis]
MNWSLTLLNSSEVSESNTWPLISVIIPLVYFLIFLVGTVGNSLVLAVLLRNGQVNNTTNLFILNLGVADLCFIVFCVPFQATIYSLDDWIFGPFMCKAVHFFIYLTMYASSFTLTTVSLDRYLAIRYPLHSRELRTPRNAVIAICFIWGLSFIFSGPYVSYFQEYQITNITVCHPIWELSQRKIMDLCTFVFSYVIPVLILSFTYLKTIRYLWTSVDPMKVMSDSKKGKRKVTRMIIIVTVLFCLCWLPHHLVILFFWFGNFPLNDVTFVLRVLSHLISYANSCVNPIVYALVSKHFRKGFKKIFSCLLHKRVTNKVHVAQVTHTVSTLEADLTEVIDVNEPVHTGASTCCHIPVQTWNKAEQLSHQEKAANSHHFQCYLR